MSKVKKSLWAETNRLVTSSGCSKRRYILLVAIGTQDELQRAIDSGAVDRLVRDIIRQRAPWVDAEQVKYTLFYEGIRKLRESIAQCTDEKGVFNMLTGQEYTPETLADWEARSERRQEVMYAG